MVAAGYISILAPWSLELRETRFWGRHPSRIYNKPDIPYCLAPSMHCCIFASRNYLAPPGTYIWKCSTFAEGLELIHYVFRCCRPLLLLVVLDYVASLLNRYPFLALCLLTPFVVLGSRLAQSSFACGLLTQALFCLFPSPPASLCSLWASAHDIGP